MIDRITLTLGLADRAARFAQGGVTAVVAHRGTIGELYFDFTYPGDLAPPDNVPGGDNTFVVLPGQRFIINSNIQQPIDFIVVSTEAVPYSVQAYV